MGPGVRAVGLLLRQYFCPVRDADLLLGPRRQLPDQYFRPVQAGQRRTATAPFRRADAGGAAAVRAGLQRVGVIR
ncbi:hypothetical protein D3C76_1728020 [compost metagenome]